MGDELDKTFSVRAELLRRRSEGRCALIPYLTMGYPSIEASVELLLALERAGADAIEVGIAFSDPIADGPTIQRTTDAALRQGATLRRALERLAEPDARDGRAPRVLFGYLNPFLRFGFDELMNSLSTSGIGAVLVTDLIPEEATQWNALCRARGIETCYLVASTSSDARIEQACEESTGFVYVVSTLGVTGARADLDRGAAPTVKRVRAKTDGPIAVGFGISSAEDVSRVREFADGAIVGSAMLRAIGEASRPSEVVDRALDFLSPLLEAAHQ
jgi:tryptophan synthase alpha chain